MKWIEEDLSIRQLQDLVDEGSLTYELLTAYYLEQIILYDSQVNAVSEVNADALTIARNLDEEYRTSGRRSPIHGMPIIIKDNINIVEGGMHTTAGSLVLENHMASYDATIVSQLRNAGAIIIGKANLTEFANFISENSPNGFSGLRGQVKNPYGAFDVGGSSSGSAVALACRFCQVAIGTETSGSIISPASSNSIIGLKPSLGLSSRYGIIPIASTQDVAGPMARHLDDIALVQRVLEAYDEKDSTTNIYKELENRSFEDYDTLLDHKELRLGIYINKDDDFERKEANKVFKSALTQLKLHHIYMEDLSYNKDDYKIDWDVLYYEFPIDLRAYLDTEEAINLRSIEDFVKIHSTDLKRYIPYDQRQFKTAIAKQSDYDTDYSRALHDSQKYGRLIDLWLMNHQLDAVCYVNCDAIDIAARNGLPSLTFPIGYTDEGQPVGFTITSKLLDEKKLLQLAYTLMPLIGKYRPVEFGDS